MSSRKSIRYRCERISPTQKQAAVSRTRDLDRRHAHLYPAGRGNDQHLHLRGRQARPDDVSLQARIGTECRYLRCGRCSRFRLSAAGQEVETALRPGEKMNIRDSWVARASASPRQEFAAPPPVSAATRPGSGNDRDAWTARPESQHARHRRRRRSLFWSRCISRAIIRRMSIRPATVPNNPTPTNPSNIKDWNEADRAGSSCARRRQQQAEEAYAAAAAARRAHRIWRTPGRLRRAHRAAKRTAPAAMTPAQQAAEDRRKADEDSLRASTVIAIPDAVQPASPAVPAQVAASVPGIQYAAPAPPHHRAATRGPRDRGR